MKRDARIGMAVVLVLGLSVTLLIARSLYKHGNTVELEGEAADASTTAKKLDADPTFTIPSGHPAAQLETTPPLVTAPDVVGPLPPETPQPAGPVATSQNAPMTTSAAPSTFYGYTVASGDSPWKISSKLFGDGKYTQKIVDANGGGSLAMKPGSVIKIPSIANRPLLVKLQPFGEKPSHSPAVAATTSKEHGHEEDHTGKSPAGKGTMYKIAKGDTLAVIARKTYGANGPSTIDKILSANKGLDAGHLQVGMEIKLPAK